MAGLAGLCWELHGCGQPPAQNGGLRVEDVGFPHVSHGVLFPLCERRSWGLGEQELTVPGGAHGVAAQTALSVGGRTSDLRGLVATWAVCGETGPGSSHATLGTVLWSLPCGPSPLFTHAAPRAPGAGASTSCVFSPPTARADRCLSPHDSWYSGGRL